MKKKVEVKKSVKKKTAAKKQPEGQCEMPPFPMPEMPFCMEDEGIFLLTGIIDGRSASQVIRWIIESNLKKMKGQFEGEKLSLIVNSMGGSMPDAFAIIDVINGSKLPVHTLGLGLIASAGLSIFMSGKHRILTPNTMILSHQYSWYSEGKEHELKAKQKAFNIASKRIKEHYKKCTGLSIKEIDKVLLPAEDRWLTAQEAKKLKLCDEIKTF